MHMAAQPFVSHQRITVRLLLVLNDVAESLGLELPSGVVKI